ncbi:hypothetical protein BGZ52_000642, partial [Haplosporangium bisporale]
CQKVEHREPQICKQPGTRGKGCTYYLYPERDRACHLRDAARGVLGIRHHQNAERSPSQGVRLCR